MKKAFTPAFTATIPVMLGYLAIGIGFGLLFANIGYSFIWAGFASVVIYAGAMQYVMLEFFSGQSDVLTIATVTLFVNMRHALYGLSFLDKFSKMGWKKFYMIFSLTDETYALLCAAKAPADVDKNKFMFCVALLNQLYWVTGSIIGALAGSLIHFNTKGIDFAMTALFLVICVDQWRNTSNHIPAILGTISSVAALLIFGSAGMLLPAMGFILLMLILFRGRMTRGETDAS